MNDRPYSDFLASKRRLDPATGLDDLPEICPALFPFQADIVRWALRRGRAGLFAGTGLGKTLMELAWGDAVHRVTGGNVLHLAPLAVAAQIIREAAKFGIPARHVRSENECGPGINVTNYQKLDHFDLTAFVGVILDESSILKSTDGHYRTKLIRECDQIPFRLAATATPAPNDFMELGNHAEFLGVMSYTDMLATFFVHDGGETQKWRLKGHAEEAFWRWMASWSVMLRKPSDLGYEDGAYLLPELRQVQHTVHAAYAPSMETGLLFPMQAASLQERIAARRDTVAERVNAAVSIVTAEFCAKLPECLGSLNTTRTDAQKLSAILSTLHGSRQGKADRPRKTGSTCEPTTKPTRKSGSGRPKSEKFGTQIDALNTSPDNGNGALARTGTNTSSGVVIAQCAPSLALACPSTMLSPPHKEASAPSAALAMPTVEDIASTSTTATTPAASVACSVAPATSGLVSSKTIGTASPEPLSISAKLTLAPWVIWCQLNSEQSALEQAFGALAISINGSHSEDEKERLHECWLAGDAPVLIVKPSMFGHGCNWQRCSNTIFVGLNDSFEQVFQAVRRFWRFGQDKPVTAHFIAAETEGAVVANLRRKEESADRMAAAMVRHMSDFSTKAVRGSERERADYQPTQPLIIPSWIGEAA